MNETKEAGTRDAIHIPTIVCNAPKRGCEAGQYVKFTENFETAVPCDREDAQGVINPFGPTDIYGGMIEVWVNPELVQKLGHVFEFKDQSTIVHAMEEMDDCEARGCY